MCHIFAGIVCIRCGSLRSFFHRVSYALLVNKTILPVATENKMNSTKHLPD
jgi:hypothetical protein